MKNYRLKFALCLALLVTRQSYFAQDCEKDISTNPDQPYNNHPFPSGLYNPWINSGFDIGSQTQNGIPSMIQLNDDMEWELSTSNFEFFNPYTSAGTTSPDGRYNYLHPGGVVFDSLDYQWEDGWELLHLGLGYYPNGEPINTAQPNRVVDASVSVPYSRVVPYMIFYNRYRGTLRFFGNLFTEFSNYSDVHIILQFEDIGSSGLSGILRHLEPFDRALDQTTNVTMHESFNPNSGDNNRWFSADFQLGYDPCVCGKNQEWKFDLYGIDEFELEMYGRGIELQMPIADDEGNPNYDVDWLSSNGVNSGLEGGNQIFTKMEGLIEDYKEALDKYEADAASYADFLEKKAILDAFKGFIVDGTTGFVAAPLKSFLKPRLPGDIDNYAAYIKAASKGLLGYGYNHLSMGINPKKSAPKPPDMPTASYSEMRFDGTIESYSEPLAVGPFFIPGSYDESGSTSFLNPYNYPAYNAPVGLSALLKTPDPLIYFESQPTVIDVIQDYDVMDPENPHLFDLSCEKKEKWRNETQFNLRFDESLEIALNSSLDFDLNQTGSYILVEVMLSNKIPENLNDLYLVDDYGIVKNGGNLFFDSEFGNSDGREYLYKSEWVLLEDLNQMIFSLDLENFADITKFGFPIAIPELIYCADPSPTDVDNIPSIIHSDLSLDVESIVLKVAHDYYFDQIGTNGDQVNTFQVFSYLMYDQDAGINHLDDESTWSTLTADFEAYTTGEVTLGSELIDTNHPAVTSVLFNGGLVIDAQRVLITDGLNIANGYTLTINALEEIRIESGVQLSPSGAVDPRIHFNIKKDFYNTPVFEYVDDPSSFCGQNGDYQSNVASIPINESNEDPSVPDEIFASPKERGSILLFPNPARDLLTLRSSHLDMSFISIHDLSGRPIKQQNLPGQTLQYQMNLSGIAPGTYIVRIDCGDEVFTEKLIIAK
jgi:hypothetical protein